MMHNWASYFGYHGMYLNKPVSFYSSLEQISGAVFGFSGTVKPRSKTLGINMSRVVGNTRVFPSGMYKVIFRYPCETGNSIFIDLFLGGEIIEKIFLFLIISKLFKN